MKKHIWYYLSFLIVIFLGLFLLTHSHGNKQLQVSFIILIAFFYITFGVVHHVKHHSITAKIVLEYVMVAALGIAIILFSLQGGF